MKTLLHFISAALLMWLAIPNTAMAGHLSDELTLSAKLTGGAEVPAVTTNALGVGSFTINSTWDTVFVNVAVNGLSGDITGAHIHLGAAGTNGGVVSNLSDFVLKNRIIGYLTGTDVTPEKLADLLAGNTYINIHTDANPNGEIRGQINLEKDWGFRADLDTAQNVTPVANNVWGVGYFNVSIDKKNLEVKTAIDGLSGAITGVHLHYGMAGMNGSVALNLTPYVMGNSIDGSIDISTMPELVDSMAMGNVYINVHTAANPNGEVRGQLWLDHRLTFDAWLDSAQQVGSTMNATGTGAAYISLNNTLDTLWYKVQNQDLTGAITGAHIHNAAVGVDGPVVLDLSSGINGNQISGMATGSAITPALVSAMLKGETYINVHTAMNPNGELRGQVYRLAREGYSLALEGNQEVPAQFAAAKGSGIISVDRNQSNAHYMIVASDLTGPLTGAHFHNAPMGVNGGVIFNLSSAFQMMGTDDAAFGYWTANNTNPFTSAVSAMFRANEVYVNLHTAAFPNGEIRGQVLRGAIEFEHQLENNGMVPMDPNFTPNLLFSAKLSGDQEVPAVMTDASGIGGFLLNETRDTIWVNINVNMLSGPITGIHIHEAEMGANGGVVTNLTDMVMEKQIQGYLTNFDLNKFITGAYYVNIHTDANPDGEIRGQIMFETDPTLMANLSGDQEVPAVSTTAQGKGVFNLMNNKSMLSVHVVVDSLSGPIMGAHLHLGAAGTNGSVVADLSSLVDGNTIVGEIDPSAYLTDLLAGDIYLNVHTAANPDGEIRGQLSWANALVVDSWLNGAQEVPMANVPGMGVGAMWMNSTWDTLYYDYQVTGLSGAITGAHIHSAAIGNNGNVLVNLSNNVMGNRIMGAITGTDLTDALIDEALWGTTYLNVHTAAYPNGEIRGQIFRLARDGYSFDMCGNQVDPSLGLNSYGGGILSVDRWASNAHLMFTTTELSGAITAAHLHDGMIGMDGGVLYDVSSSVTAGSGYSYFDIDSANTAKIKMGGTYLNVHTADNPNGEVRGQIDNMWDCPSISTGINDDVFSQTAINVYPNPVTDQVSIAFDDLSVSEVNLQVIDVLGTVVYSQKISSVKNVETIDLEALTTGVYFIQLNANDSRFTQRIIKK